MSKQLCVLVFLLFCVSSQAQIDQYLKYQKAISFAEMELVKGNSKSALEIYKDILLNLEGNFITDIYNALLTAHKLNDTDSFYQLLKLLLPKALSNEYINSLEVFNSYHKDRPWVAFLNENEHGPKMINYELRRTLQQLESRDQQFRILDGSSEKNGDTIAVIDQKNMDYLFNLIKENNFPGERELGNINIQGKQPFDIIFHHHSQNISQKTNNKKDITALLIDLALSGKVPPSKCAFWIDLQNTYFNLGVFDILRFKVNGNLTNCFKPNYTQEQVTLINQNRRLLGMSPISEYHEKLKFKLKNPDSLLIFNLYMNTLELDKASFDAITSSMVEIGSGS